MNKIKCNVILCGPAIGKTYLASINDKFVDIDGKRSEYKHSFHSNVEEYTLNLLKNTIDNNKIALISFHEFILNYLKINNIDYCLVYSSFNDREEYIRRMKERGNSEDFISNMTDEDNWKIFYDKNVNDNIAKYKIELDSNQYLSDIVDKFDI